MLISNDTNIIYDFYVQCCVTLFIGHFFKEKNSNFLLLDLNCLIFFLRMFVKLKNTQFTNAPESQKGEHVQTNANLKMHLFVFIYMSVENFCRIFYILY